MISAYYWHHHGVKVATSFLNKIWWKLMPGVTVKVKWPSGNIVVDHNDPRWQDMGGAVRVDLGFSADPNDHYRHWMESIVGRQGWDWDWTLMGNDILENKLTIKFRKGKEKFATVALLLWS